MNIKYWKAMITPLTATVLMLALLLSNISPASAQEIPKENIIYGSGFWPSQVSFNPILMDWGQGWDTYVMYEPMFGVNAANGQIIYWLGESISWLNSTCIKVVLRDGIKWTDGTAITAEDVNYTYWLHGAFPNSPNGGNGITSALVGFRDRVTSFIIESPQVFYVNLNSTYADSEVVWRALLTSYEIVPAHIWKDIYTATGGDIAGFANDWLDSGFNATWKVASGMYLPYWHASTHDRTILKRNDNWWGITVFGETPGPGYFGYINYASNPPAVLDLENGDLDWCSIFIPGIADVMASYSNVHTFFENSPYYVDMSVKMMVPNHRVYPLNEPWLHQAIASVFDFIPLNAAGGGVLKPASPLLLPADDAVARELLNTTIEDEYRVDFNVTKALEILNQYCYYVDGMWYTKTGPSAEWLAAYGADAVVPDDALTDNVTYPGKNVPLGPWKLMDVLGWTDVNAIDVVICDYVTRLLNITLTTEWLEYNTVVSKFTSNDFDFDHFCGEMASGTMYQRYNQMFNGTVGYYTGHYGDYRNPELGVLIDSLDTATGQAKQNIANQIQEIIGSEMPLIPIIGHPNWYVYSDKYFTGWSNENNPLSPAGAYGGSSNNAVLQSILLGLQTHVTVSFSNLRVSKTNVVPGETTTISVDVTNTQATAGVNTIEFLINGTLVNSQDVSFAASETKTVSFNASRQDLGTYRVTVSGYSGTTTFIVVEAPVVPAYIVGNVTDADTGDPISGATVIAGSYTTTTAANGTYSLEVVPGTYNITVVMDGYDAGTTTVAASLENTTYTANIALTPVPSAEVMPLWGYAAIAVFVIIAVVAIIYAFVFKKK
jgi:peptide/nickel transport system substrate-binding protein